MNMTMNTNPTLTEPTLFGSARLHRHCTSLSWAAILGGLTATLAMQVLFMMLGAGLGLAIYHPTTSDNPVENFSTGSMVVHGISAVFSLWFGGWVAGRFTPLVARASGALHGFLVWCAATVAGVLVVALGAGWMIGDLAKVVGGGLSAAGKPAAAAVSGGTDLAKDALKQSGDTLTSFTDEAMAARPNNANNRADAVRAKREVGLAIARLFNPALKDKMADNKTALTKALVDSGMSQADADRMVNDWTASYDRLKADLAATKEQAEAKARATAEEAAKNLALFSLVAFFAFAIGAGSAACGGCQGAKSAFKHDDRGEVPV